MNKSYLKTILYIIIGVIVAVVFVRILPYLLLAGGVAYVVLKIVRYLKDKTDGVRFENNSSYTSNSDKVHTEDEVDPSQAIDVDFKDV